MKTLTLFAVAFALTTAAQEDDEVKPAHESPAAPAKAAAVKPMAELDKIKWMVGTWKGDCKASASDLGPANTFKTTVTIGKSELDGHWYPLRYEEKKGPGHPMAHISVESWGYDTVAKTFVRIAHGNVGDWGVAWSGGWQDNKMTWTGEINDFMGQKVEYTHTLTKKSATEVSDSWALKMGGEMKTISECNYKR